MQFGKHRNGVNQKWLTDIQIFENNFKVFHFLTIFKPIKMLGQNIEFDKYDYEQHKIFQKRSAVESKPKY